MEDQGILCADDQGCQQGLSKMLAGSSTSTSTSQFREQDETESFIWNHNTTLIFLDLYQEYRKQVGSLKVKNLKKMFEEIAKELRVKTKQNMTGANCENRWKHLERMYKKYVDNNNKTGRGRKDFEYAEIMDNILGKRRNIHPVLLLSSAPVISQEMEEENTATVHTNIDKGRIIEANEVENTHQATPKKVSSVTPSYKNKSLKINVLKEIRQDRQNFYKKCLDIEEKKLQEKQIKNKILKERNELLKQYLTKDLSLNNTENTPNVESILL